LERVAHVCDLAGGGNASTFDAHGHEIIQSVREAPLFWRSALPSLFSGKFFGFIVFGFSYFGDFSIFDFLHCFRVRSRRATSRALRAHTDLRRG
jgi:hypothetical protein